MKFDHNQFPNHTYRVDYRSRRGGRTLLPAEVQHIAERPFLASSVAIAPDFDFRDSGRFSVLNWDHAAGARCLAKLVAERGCSR